jgi:hypothetical protein
VLVMILDFLLHPVPFRKILFHPPIIGGAD